MQDWIIQFFDVHVSRLGTHSSKWDRPNQDKVLPFSVADMDFYSKFFLITLTWSIWLSLCTRRLL
jgi:hypothetical protein